MDSKPTDLKTTLTTPGWRRLNLLKKPAALTLVALATVLFFRSFLTYDPEAIVFTQDVAAGSEVTESDIRKTTVPREYLAESAVKDAQETIGRSAASTITAGEIATPVRFIGNDLTASFLPDFAHEDATLNMVPLRLADPAIIPLLLHGDTISVITQDKEPGWSKVLAPRGKAILSAQTAPSTILVALPENTAQEVAAHFLDSPLTVVLIGTRSHADPTAGEE